MSDVALEAVVVPYETRVRQDRRWGMDEGDKFFQRSGAVFSALRKITRKLRELGIPHAVVGGMALDAHGFRRLTVDVDILVRREDLKTIHERLTGLGWVPPFTGSKNLRDAEHGVRVEFLVAGEFPGDGLPKPVAFPDPAKVAVDLEGFSFINLPSLVELKIASGLTNPGRLKDLGDVQELIKALDLPAEFAEGLNPYVRDKFRELWQGALKDTPEE
jgi:hypothetical protein